MDCLYNAFAVYADYLGCEVKPSTWTLYKAMKLITHGAVPQYTYGGVAPWMIHRMAAHNGLRVWVAAYQYLGVDEYLAISKQYYPAFYPVHKLVIKKRYLGKTFAEWIASLPIGVIDPLAVVDGRLSAMGIWLDASTQHAQFKLTRPRGVAYAYFRLAEA